MKTTLFYAITGGTIDRAAGIIRGVSALTEGEAKGHGVRIDRKSLETFKACADKSPGGVLVKADHGTGFAAIVGVMEDFRIDGTNLRADLRLVKSDAQYQKTMDLAETMPGAFGLSPSFHRSDEKINGDSFARCNELYSVDLVDRPAANPTGLFSVDSKPINRMADVAEFISGLFGKNGTVTDLQTSLAETRAELAASRTEGALFKTKAEQATTDLATAKASIASLTKEKDDAAAKHATDLKAKDTAFAVEVKKLGSMEAKQILASLGQPPLETKPGTTGGEDVLAQFAAITSPTERTAFYRKNKAAYDAAFAASQKEPKP